MKRRFPLLLAFALAAALVGAPSAAPPDSGFFPVAVWYSGGTARAPMLSPIDASSPQRWRDDLDEDQGAWGSTPSAPGSSGAAGEPRQGEYHLENLDLLLKLADEAGLRVLVQVYVDSAPEWVGRTFPDGHFVSQGGTAIRSQAAPGYCVDHPGVRGAVQAFFREVARRASTSRAFHAYDLWSEPAVMNWALPTYVPNAQFCYCAHSMARFREWLKVRHGSIDALNRAWYRTFQRVGRRRAAALRHHPDLRGLHGLARLHRREDRGGPEGARRRRAFGRRRRTSSRATRPTRRRCSARWPTRWTPRTTT